MILLLSTRNRHKAEEIGAMLGSGHQLLTLADLPPSPEVVEDADTFEGNALKKATEIARWWQVDLAGGAHLAVPPPGFVLADDSGLEVDALEGAPGVRSARFAALDSPGPGRNRPDADNNARLLRLLAAVPEALRTARFRCVIGLVPCEVPEGPEVSWTFEGTCEGRIAFAPSGQGGFGYDPLFIPKGYGQSFAELGREIKDQMSHRSRAVAQLKRFLNDPARAGLGAGRTVR